MDDLPSGSLHVRLSSAIESIDQLFEQIRNIVQRKDRERLYELLRCRRLLTSQIDTLAHLAEEAADKASEETLRRRVADLRYQIAEHQSRWPAVMIDGSAEYQRSATSVMHTYRDLSLWLRTMLL